MRSILSSWTSCHSLIFEPHYIWFDSRIVTIVTYIGTWLLWHMRLIHIIFHSIRWMRSLVASLLMSRSRWWSHLVWHLSVIMAHDCFAEASSNGLFIAPCRLVDVDFFLRLAYLNFAIIFSRHIITVGSISCGSGYHCCLSARVSSSIHFIRLRNNTWSLSFVN